MAENPKLENVDSGSLNSSCEASEFEEMGTQRISVSDQTNSLQYTNIKPDSFIVDMERFPHHTDKEVTANSRLTIQRSLSRKGSQRGGEKKINASTGSERDVIVGTSTPRAALGGVSTPEKSMVVTVGATDIHPFNPQLHHQITIMTGGNTSGATTTESKCGVKRLSFRRSSVPSWAIDPRRILFFFATLSSMGTMLLIYFTLSMGKLSEDGDGLNW